MLHAWTTGGRSMEEHKVLFTLVLSSVRTHERVRSCSPPAQSFVQVDQSDGFQLYEGNGCSDELAGA